MRDGQRRPRILCVASSASRLEPLLSPLQHFKLDHLAAYTSDQAVAVAVSSHVDVVLLDAECIRASEWSVANTLKLVCPKMPIVLLEQRNEGRCLSDLPPGVDASTASGMTQTEVVKMIEELLNTSACS